MGKRLDVRSRWYDLKATAAATAAAAALSQHKLIHLSRLGTEHKRFLREACGAHMGINRGAGASAGAGACVGVGVGVSINSRARACKYVRLHIHVIVLGIRK